MSPILASTSAIVPAFIVVMVGAMLFWTAQGVIRGRTAKARTARKIYGAIVTQARQPWFFAEAQVPDTLEGRFGVVVVHVYLLADRLRRAGRAGELLSRALIEAFITDMDDNMREIGIGDLSVPRKIKAAAGALYERMRAYDRALAEPGAASLAEVLAAHTLAADGRLLAGYMVEMRAALDRQSPQALLNGDVSFQSEAGTFEAQEETMA